MKNYPLLSNGISRFCIVFILLVLPFIVEHSMLMAEEKVRPFILVTPAERNVILEKIETQEWAKSIFLNLQKNIDKEVALHRQNPHKYLKQLPFDWSQANGEKYPPFHLTCHIENGRHKNLDNATKEEWSNAALLIKYLQLGVDCGMAYFITEDEKYAQYATDILYSFVKSVQQSKVSDWHGRGGWLFPDDGFREVREIGYKVPLIYDFVAEYIKNNGLVYDIVAEKKVNFSIEDAQQVFRTYADLSINYGQIGSNHCVLEAPNLVYNALAMDNEEERENLLSYFLTKNTKNQDALDVMALNYPKKGDVWPETSQYLNHSTSILTRLMLIINRYNPELKLGDKYTNILYALPRVDYLVYPNQELVRWGDGKRYGTAPYYSYEDAYVLAKMDGLKDVVDTFSPLINQAKQEEKYKRNGMEAIFWYGKVTEGESKLFTLDRTDRVYHAGIFLQRNLSSTQQSTDGLMCFVGGGHMVHGHAEGMNMELYGEGQVLGVDNGRGRYAKDIHENYSRIFAAHNTVVVNGSSQGEGGWSNLGINSVELISMEPQVGAIGVSPNYSFTQTSFKDDKGDKAEAIQERTLALIRTSPTTGYYVDVFRSKSKLPNEYHDYLYHNIGDRIKIENTDMNFCSTPDRYMENANGEWNSRKFRNPGWHFFREVNTSLKYDKDVKAQFAAEQLENGPVYMQLFIPGFENREYTKAMAPQTFQAPIPYDSIGTPTLVIRKNGEAWKNPFVVVYEPFKKTEKNPSIKSVEKITHKGVYKGVKVISEMSDRNIVQYIITQSKGETFKDSVLGIEFTGSFGLITLDSNGKLQNMYIGEGQSLVCGEVKLIANNSQRAFQTY